MADVLNPDALQQGLEKLDGWSGTTGEGIRKDYRFTDFAEAMRFTNRVADLAEAANHHPDLAISYNQVSLTLITHSAGGVTQNDLDLASQIDGDEPR